MTINVEDRSGRLPGQELRDSIKTRMHRMPRLFFLQMIPTRSRRMKTALSDLKGQVDKNGKIVELVSFRPVSTISM